MVLHASGTIFASQIRSEFNRNTSGTFFLGSNGRALDSRLPQSGQIRFSNFYNKYFRPATGNLRVWLDAKEYSGSGTTWTDLQGNANGTLVNAPSYANPYFEFNGTNQYATVPDITNVTDFTSSDSYTISGWVWLNSTQNDTGNGDNDIIEKWGVGGGYPYVIRLDRPNAALSVAAYNGGATGTGTATSNNTVIYNDWNHISAVFDWPSRNFLGNESFGGGSHITQYSAVDSFGTNNIVTLTNPGDSGFVLQQAGSGGAEYQINLTTELVANTTYTLSGWYSKSTDYNGGDTMFHARAHSTSGAHNELGVGLFNILETRVVGGLTWYFCYATLTTPADYNNNFAWFVGYGTTNTTGFRYYTKLSVIRGTFPKRALNLYINGKLNKDANLANITSIDNTHPIYLMCRGGPINFTTGRFGMLTVHNTALSASEISRLYYSTRNVFEIDAVELENGTWNVVYEYVNPKRNASGILIPAKEILGIYPPTAMTSDSTNITGQTYANGTYVSSASSVNNTTYEQAYRAFETSTNPLTSSESFWRSTNNTYNSSTGQYAGSVTTAANGTTYSGEWLQIQLPVAIVLNSFSITPRQDSTRETTQSPRSFVVLGSNDGSSWNLLYETTNTNNWTTAAKTFATTGIPNAYSYYRIVIRRVGNFDTDATNNQIAVNIASWQLFTYNTINRIGYFMQNNMGNGSTMYWVFVTMDAYTSTLSQLKIPDEGNIFSQQRNVSNIRVYSNHPQVGHYHAANGRLEIWPSNYGTGSNLGGGSSATYDFDDTNSGGAGYGCAQVHDITNSKTILAWNDHRNGQPVCVGIGNNDTTNIHYTATGGAPDWTFANNGAYNWKFQVLIGTIPIEPTTMESGTWRLLYEITNPKRDVNGILSYAKDNAALLGDRQFTKVGYYMQNNMGNGATAYYVYVTMDAYTTSLRDLKIPDLVDRFVNQRNVRNLNVYSNHPQVGTYSAANGRLEIWPWGYQPNSNLGGGSNTVYDFDDTHEGTNDYGSVQVHDITNSKTLLSWNRHRLTETAIDIGIGNNDATNIHYTGAGGHPDWTFANNGAYNWKFQVFIRI